MDARVAIFSCLVLLVQGKAQRMGRFFAGEYTKTLQQTHVITSVVPYSCIEVEPSLPVCRSVRNLKSFPTVGGYVVQQTKNATNLSPEPYIRTNIEPEIFSTSLGWMEYLGFTGRTVTKVEHVIETVTVQDPNVAVTFSIKGCKPSALPLDMDRCEPPPTVRIEEFLPTSTMGYVITPTTSVELPDDGFNGPVVEATEISGDGEKPVEETQPLQDLTQ